MKGVWHNNSLFNGMVIGVSAVLSGQEFRTGSPALGLILLVVIGVALWDEVRGA